MSILSKLKKGVSNVVGSVKGALGIKTPVKTYTPAPKVTFNQSAMDKATATRASLGIPSLSGSIGGVTTPNLSVAMSKNAPASSLNAPAKATLAASNAQSGGVSGGQVADSFSSTDNVSSLSRSSTPTIVAPGTSTISSTSYSAPVSVASLSTPSTPVNLPSAPSAGLSLPTAASNLTNVGEGDGATPIVTEPTTTSSEENKYSKMMEDAISGLTNSKPGRTDYGREDALESSGYNQALKEANDISNQISSIYADTESKKLSLIGQGRGIPEAIIGGQQAKLDREAAIKTMPLTAQYKAAVGLVDAAKEIVNNFVADERAYQQSLQTWQNNVFSSVYQYASAQQKNAIDEQRRLTDRQYELEDAFLQDQTDYFKMTLDTGQKEVGSQIMKATTREQLQTAVSRIQGQSGSSAKAPEIKSINGKDMQWDSVLGWIEPKVSGTTGKDLTGNQSSISTVDELLNSQLGASTAIGTSALSRSTGFWGNIGRIGSSVAIGAGGGAIAGSVLPGPGTIGGAIIGAGLGLVNGLLGTTKQAVSQLTGAEQTFLGDIATLVSGLSLEALQKAKANGATFGALSDAEWKILGQSATAISKWERRDDTGNVLGYNISEKSFKKELQKINNFAKLDYLKKGGNAADVGVNITPEGRMWVRNFEGNLEEIISY